MDKTDRKLTCFVAMGFGEKTAFYAGKKKQRLLNLDMTYEHIIKPTVEAAGHICIRADEILHSTLIDKPMYEHLLNADIVIADLSTSNANAIYELGVRHALKPWSTIVMAEKEFAFPFDLSHLSILKYEHLGSDIGAGEARRKIQELGQRLAAIADRREVDSPVFLFLPQLRRDQDLPLSGVDRTASEPAGPSLAELRDAFAEAKRLAKQPSDWSAVIKCLRDWQKLQPEDPYLIQQLALATYKAEQPDKGTALVEAKQALEALTPRVSSDAETVGLWGAIHKRLWEQHRAQADLNEAIRAHARGYLLKYDHYNGINYAFLLDVRASCQTGDEAIADRVMASRIRREVLDICDDLLKKPPSETADEKELYWIHASRVEALFGLGRHEEATSSFKKAKEMQPKPDPWMVSTTEQQLKKLGELRS